MIKQKELEKIYSFFNDYIGRFDFDGEDSRKVKLLKYEHTLRVVKLCKELGRAVFSSDEDINMCEAIGLLHDIGRWKQYYKYRSFLDAETEDHAKMSVDVLAENKVLDDLDPTDKEIILASVFEHNKRYITNINDEKCLTFSKIVRDADKIDNYHVECEIYDADDKEKKVKNKYPDTRGISEKVYEAVNNRKLVDIRDIKNVNDFKFNKLAWIYDMNFRRSFEIVKEMEYVDRIFKKIKEPTEQMQELYGHIKEFLERRLEHVTENDKKS